MKTISIHPTEELTSIIDRLEKEKSSEIILEIPSGAQIFASLINFKLLKRWAGLLDKLITISTEDETGIFLAQKVGFSIATFKNTNMTQKSIHGESSPTTPEKPQKKQVPEMITKFSRVLSGIGSKKKPVKMTDIIRRKTVKDKGKTVPSLRPPERRDKEEIPPKRPSLESKFYPKPELQPIHRKRNVFILSTVSSKSIIIFLLAAIFTAGFVLFLILPRVKVEILPKTEPLSLDLEIIADINLDIEDILAQKIPAKKILVVKQNSKTVPATERKLLKQKASGVIQVLNEWSSQSQTLIKTTRFLSEGGKLFRTLKTVVVPGAKIVAGITQPGKIDVEVEAADIGEDYNIGPSDFSIPAFKEYQQPQKYSSIYGKSKKSMTGGANREEIVISEQDLKKAEEELVQALSSVVNSEFQEQLGQEYKLMENTSRLETKNLSSSHKVGEPTQEFTVTAEVSLEAIVFKEQILKSFIDSLVYSRIPEDKILLAETQEITYTKTETDFKKGQMKLSLHLEEVLVFKIDENKLKEELVGKDKSQVREILSSYTTIEKAQVSFWPFWVKQVPNSSKKIHIILTK